MAIGVPSNLNMIGNRHGHAMVVNPVTGSVLIFGGTDSGTFAPYFSLQTNFVHSDQRILTDLWLWDPKSGYWTCISDSGAGAARPLFSAFSSSMTINMNNGLVYLMVGKDSGMPILYFQTLAHSLPQR